MLDAERGEGRARRADAAESRGDADIDEPRFAALVDAKVDAGERLQLECPEGLGRTAAQGVDEVPRTIEAPVVDRAVPQVVLDRHHCLEVAGRLREHGLDRRRDDDVGARPGRGRRPRAQR